MESAPTFTMDDDATSVTGRLRITCEETTEEYVAKTADLVRDTYLKACEEMSRVCGPHALEELRSGRRMLSVYVEENVEDWCWECTIRWEEALLLSALVLPYPTTQSPLRVSAPSTPTKTMSHQDFPPPTQEIPLPEAEAEEEEQEESVAAPAPTEEAAPAPAPAPAEEAASAPVEEVQCVPPPALPEAPPPAEAEKEKEKEEPVAKKPRLAKIKKVDADGNVVENEEEEEESEEEDEEEEESEEDAAKSRPASPAFTAAADQEATVAAEA
jgi:hypothetical protein